MRAIAALIAFGAMAVSTGAVAGTCNGEFGWLSKGTAYNLDEGAFIFTGEFSGTFFNADTGDPTHKMTTQCPGVWHVKAGGAGNANGACIGRDAEGDQIFFEWSGSGAFPEVSGPFQLVGGTGKFSGVSGSGMFKGVTVAADQGGNSMGYATWWDCSYSMGN